MTSSHDADFGKFKRGVIRIAKNRKVGHLIPNSDLLFALWGQRLSPEQVVTQHCTEEAQKRRHGL